MKFKNYLLLCFVAITAITACKKSSVHKPSITVVKMDTDVYVVGTITADNHHDMAALWKNGVLDTLSTDPTKDWDATGIALYKGKVYVSGYQVPSIGNFRATYWVDGQQHDLSPTVNAFASGIGVNDNGVYVVGTVNNNTAVYWKNDADYATLPRVEYVGDNSSNAYGVYANGSNLYIAGYVGGGSAAYWKNDTLVDLGKGSYTVANAITSDGANVYTAGVDYTNALSSAAFWKNNATTLNLPSSSTFDCSANAVAVSGNDVYVVGSTSDAGNNQLPLYWKNGEPVPFIGGGSLNAIAVVGTDVYVTGGTSNNGPSAYWKNGVKHTLNGSKNYSASGIAVVVHPHQ